MRRGAAAVLVLLLLLSGCGGGENVRTEEKFPTFTFTHYASGGADSQETAVILFEQSNSTFTSYQVAFPSCTCRDSIFNYMSVAYVELLNN